MALRERHVYAIEQISARWGVDDNYVRDLVLTRQLAQAYMLFGLAKLNMVDSAGHMVPHPHTASGHFFAGILASTVHTMPDPLVWPLSQILRVFEFTGVPAGRLSLLQFRDYDRSQQLGWTITFEREGTTIVGHNSTIISFDDLRRYEAANGVVGTAAAPPKVAQHFRDTRKQRCRAIAELLWRRDGKATLSDIYRHEWIRQVACSGSPPAEKTFRDWVKDLNPNRNPGRRPR